MKKRLLNDISRCHNNECTLKENCLRWLDRERGSVTTDFKPQGDQCEFQIKNEEVRKVYIIYDGRYKYDPSSAVVLDVCDTKKEAFESHKDFGNDSVIVQWEVDGKNLKKPQIIN